ncbi:MAG: hypothetical protein ISP49_05190 [Reyranella sp.]|nr:hypothetical protein [Reyranella sp.]MBL6650966.1 hypothetical protein [Reyranella sp.]
MPVFILLGWLVGLVLGALATVTALLSLGFALQGVLGALGGVLAPMVAALGSLALAVAILFLVMGFLVAYLIATRSIAPLLPAGATFPLAAPFPTPVPVTLAATPGEFFGRGLLIGMNVSVDVILLSLVPIVGPVLATWAFTVISLAAVIFVARNRVYQGFLGWSAWLFPLSWLATVFGLLLFFINIPFAFTAFGIGAFAFDWTTGVIETRGGLSGVTGFNGGFSLGNFTFLAGTTAAGAAAGRFTTPSTSSHETGHSLNTAAMGGVVLWINAIDENIFPSSENLAYGELTAEGHSRNMPGTAVADFSLRLWF